MGREHAVSILHRPRRCASPQGGDQRTPPGVQGFWLAGGLRPDPQSPATFERSVLNWDEVHEGSHARMLDVVPSVDQASPVSPFGRGPRAPDYQCAVRHHAQPVAVLAERTARLLQPRRCGSPRARSVWGEPAPVSGRCRCDSMRPSPPARLPSGASPRPLVVKRDQPAATGSGVHNGSSSTNDAPPPGVDSAVISPPWSRASSRER